MGDEIERPEHDAPEREIEPPEHESPVEKAEREYNEAADRNDIVGMEKAKEAMEGELSKPD